MDNVTPIRPPAPAKADQPSKPRRPRSKRSRKGLLLRASEDSEGFTTTDLINGLHGVCVALDDAIVNRFDGNNAQYLAQAAKVLSTMVRDRVE